MGKEGQPKRSEEQARKTKKEAVNATPEEIMKFRREEQLEKALTRNQKHTKK